MLTDLFRFNAIQSNPSYLSFNISHWIRGKVKRLTAKQFSNKFEISIPKTFSKNSNFLYIFLMGKNSVWNRIKRLREVLLMHWKSDFNRKTTKANREFMQFTSIVQLDTCTHTTEENNELEGLGPSELKATKGLIDIFHKSKLCITITILVSSCVPACICCSLRGSMILMMIVCVPFCVELIECNTFERVYYVVLLYANARWIHAWH